MEGTIANSPPQKNSARRNANNHFQAWEQRTARVKQQTASASAANDAKTARLKALRLAKEEEDRKTTEAAPKPPAKKSVRRIHC